MDLNLCSTRTIYLQKFDINKKRKRVVEDTLFREEKKERKFRIDFCAIKHVVHVPSRNKSTCYRKWQTSCPRGCVLNTVILFSSNYFFSGICSIAAPVLHPKDPACRIHFLSYFGHVINKHELRLTMELLNCNILLPPPFRTSLLAGKKLQSVCKYCFVNPTEGPFT